LNIGAMNNNFGAVRFPYALAEEIFGHRVVLF
jgi:hypothetical protein